MTGAGDDPSFESALKWAQQKSADLAKHESDLVFRLHKAQYLKLLREAILVWQTILDDKPIYWDKTFDQNPDELGARKYKNNSVGKGEADDEEMKDESTLKVTPAPQKPTQSDFEHACQKVYLYARENLRPFIAASEGNMESGKLIREQVF